MKPVRALQRHGPPRERRRAGRNPPKSLCIPDRTDNRNVCTRSRRAIRCVCLQMWRILRRWVRPRRPGRDIRLRHCLRYPHLFPPLDDDPFTPGPSAVVALVRLESSDNVKAGQGHLTPMNVKQSTVRRWGRIIRGHGMVETEVGYAS